MKRILVIGSWRTTHIRRFLRVLCENKDEGLIIDAFDPNMEEGQPNECGVNHVYRVNTSWIEKRFLRLRKIGTYFYEKKKEMVLSEILKSEKYDLVNIHFIPTNIINYVVIAHKLNCKVMLTPFGSDVLRVKKYIIPSIQNAFDACDYVSVNIITGFCQSVKTKFHVDEKKIVNLGYGSETLSAMVEMKGKYDRTQLAEMLSLPPSSCYVCCGYTANVAQRHSVMIDAIASNKELLPSDFCAIFPLSYGPNKEMLKQKIREQCDRLGIQYHLIADYMTKEQVAALRYVSDIMIHIQPTDAYSASIQEYLLGGTAVINGKWLEYPSLERHGKPYYICESVETLGNTLANVLTGKARKSRLDQEIIDEIISNAWDNKIQKWIKFYQQV